MNPSRYYIIDEKSPYPVKRRGGGRREEKGYDRAITLLPPDPYLIMERPEYARSPSPTVYRTVPPKSARNKEASSFVILGETIRTPVQSRPASPSGRVSPFRGHGFKSPSTTRPNSRAPSPSPDSPRKNPSTSKSTKNRVVKDIGLPPKSPMKSTKPKSSGSKQIISSAPQIDSQEEKVDTVKKVVEKTETETTQEKTEPNKDEAETSKDEPEISKNEPEISKNEPEISKDELETNKEETEKIEDALELLKEHKIEEEPKEKSDESKPEEEKPEKVLMSKPKGNSTPRERLVPTQPREKKPPVSPRPKTKLEKNETNIQQKQSVIKRTTKPPIPPKKIGMKMTLKADDSGNDQNKKVTKEVPRGKSSKEKEKPKPIEKKTMGEAMPQKKPEEAVSEVKETEKSTTISLGDAILDGKEKIGEVEKKVGEKEGEKLIPCFQPDKCQIAPPTMASPSPIITPTISTPSTSADLASSSMKNSQSIAAAPTTVTSSSLSSVSSTVVLTGNLARREIENRSKPKESSIKVEPDSDSGVVEQKKSEVVVEPPPPAPPPPDKVSSPMVKAASKDSIKWSNKDNLSGEITSATKVIKSEPDMEVLSPNNLRNSPPRMPPPNVAWDDERLPNGDVPAKAENESKIRRFFSTIWRFLSLIFCCRCLKNCKCCRKKIQDEPPKPSILSRLKCCRGKSCCFPCKSKCCEGKKCCRKKPKPERNPKPKSRKCCAKENFCCKGFCDKMKNGCSNCRDKLNNSCRSLFCLNMMCCQSFLRKFKFFHKFKCCQKSGFCSCCNPNVRRDTKKLHKKGSHASNHSRDKDNLDQVLVEHTSLMKAAIPVLPACLAIFCLILNLFVPGFGTFISGILCLCFGKPRFSAKDTPKNRFGSFIVNTIIGIAQLFTIVFCLVGWGWSIWWGVIMYKLSRRQKRLKLAEKNQKEAEGSNVNHNHVDVEQG